MNACPKNTVLCILDGFGLNPRQDGNAIAIAKKPNIDALVKNYPSSTLATSGEQVGLPAGQMGNSEVGHLNIGAGRVVEQWLSFISRELKEGFLEKSAEYQNALKAFKASKTIHLIGLYSDGGVHSHYDHLHLLIDDLSKNFDGTIAIHLLTDGRDVSPHASLDQIKSLEKLIEQYPAVKISTVIGRFYAMDRDKRWERVEQAYQAIVESKAPHAADKASEYVAKAYEAGTTDEFLEPAIIDGGVAMNPDDGLIFWNFRADRAREIVSALAMKDFEGFTRTQEALNPSRVLCFTEYDENFKLPFLFSPVEINNHLGEVISKAGLSQLRTAETEKYAHVTYFFNGGIEEQYPGEERKLIPSPKEVKTYDQKPEMSALQVAEVVVDAIKQKKFELIVVNFANSDMVGHTGVIEAAVKAVEAVDSCVGKITAALNESGGQMLIIADHGNSDQMINYEDSSPHTAHTTHPVPVILYNSDKSRVADTTLRSDGALCDVAPTMLKLMGLEQPAEMTGKALY